MLDSDLEWEGTLSTDSDEAEWDMETDYFFMTAEVLIDANKRDHEGDCYWRIQGFPLWDGTKDGIAHADTPKGLLEVLTVRGDWSLRWRLNEWGGLTVHLSHHDASGTMEVTPTPNPDR